MKTTLMTVTAGVAALSVLVAANSFAFPDTSVSSLSAAVDSAASAVTRSFSDHGGRGMGMFGPNVTIGNVVALENGFTAEITSTDADAIAKIQERAADGEAAKFLGKLDSNVVTNVANIDAGVKVTVTSSDAATATKLVEMSAKLKEGKGFGWHKGPEDDSTRTVTVLENGFVMEIAAKDATDADAIAEIQEREANAPKGPEVDEGKATRTVENTATGVKVTVTSSDATVAAKLVEMGTNMKDGKMPMGGHHGGPREDGFMMDSTNTVTVLENGFVMEIAAKDTTDVDAITKIQTRAAEMNGKMPGNFMGLDSSSVTHAVENTATGVKVTVTSSDATVAAKLVEIGTDMKDGKMPMGERGPREERGFDQNDTRTVTALSNGFTIEITAKDATDADAIAEIQEREANAPKGPEVDEGKATRTVENIATGVKVTVTSTDADTAAKLVAQAGRMQEREARMKEMKSTQSAGRENANHRGRMGNNDGAKAQEGNSTENNSDANAQ
jgi:hypothetical protein